MPKLPAIREVARRGWVQGVLVGIVAFGVFAHDLASEPEFVDEWAYIAHSYFLEELAHPRSSRWLNYPAYDLPPLPKYAIGLALLGDGYNLPPITRAWMWYQDTSSRFGPHAMLVSARRPSVLLGALGCVAIYALGTLALGRSVGLVAAALLILDPLYRMHARRAMSDVYAECFILWAAAVGLFAWRRLLSGRMRSIVGVVVLGYAGMLGGLAVLSKLNGGLAVMVLAAWALLAAVLYRFPIGRRVAVAAGMALAGATSFGTFVLLNPFVTAPGWQDVDKEVGRGVIGRCAKLIRHRIEVPRGQQRSFSHNALTTPGEKLAAVAVQGFGRFGPLGRKVFDPRKRIWWFDSRVRFDARQDWGAILWLPVVASGVIVFGRGGWRRYRAGEPPTAWAILVQAAVTIGTVTAFLPLAWDRFYTSIQPVACLLGAGAIVAAWQRLRGGNPGVAAGT